MEDEGFNDRDFGAHSRSFSTCSPTLRVSSRDSHARLTSGWLAGLYREGVEPTGSLRKVSDHMVTFPVILTLPSSPLRFRTAGFPRYGSKAGLSDRAFPDPASVKLAPSIPVALIRFATTLRALRSSMGSPFSVGATCSVDHRHPSDVRRSTPGALAPVQVMLSSTIIT